MAIGRESNQKGRYLLGSAPYGLIGISQMAMVAGNFSPLPPGINSNG